MVIKKIYLKLGLHNRSIKQVILPEDASDDQIGMAFISEWIQFVIKIAIAVSIIVTGILFIKNAVGGKTSYIVKLTGLSELHMTDGPLGLIIVLLGAFIVWRSQLVIIIKK